MAGSTFEQAVAYARRAGDRELALLAHEESASDYELALQAHDLADDRDEGVRCELLLSLGDARSRAGDDAAVNGLSLTPPGRAAPSPAARACSSRVGYGGRIVSLRGDERLVPLLEAGLAGLSDDDVELRARLLVRLAGALGDERWRDRRVGALRSSAPRAPPPLLYRLLLPYGEFNVENAPDAIRAPYHAASSVTVYL